ncbi:MAG: tetratricopeptide repeat protein [Rhodothermales bacterium]|nr:tetratricopeptide repeat protein [Rhodothermales bacterium]
MRPLVIGLILLVLALTGRPGPAYAQDAAYEALQTGDYAAAQRAYEASLEEAGGRGSKAALYLGEIYRAKGAYESGLQAIDGHLRRAPDDAFLLHARGRLLEAMGRLDEAGAAYRASAEKDISNLRNVLALALVFERQGQLSQAGDLYSAIFRRYKNNELTTADDLGAAALAGARLGEFRDANEAFRLAYRLEPGHVENLYWWAELFREKYNDADAQRTYQEAIARNPNYAPLYTGMAKSVNGFEAKEQLARQALGANPNSVEAHSILAGLAILDGLFAEAEVSALRALDTDPSSIEALGHLASSYYLQGDTARYADVERRALGINPRASEFYLTLAHNCEMKFRYPDAVDFGLEAVQVDRRNPKAYAQLGTSLLRLGRAQEARRYLDFSFEQDPFNVFVGNTLELLDEYEDFALLDSEHFRLLIHSTERDVLGPAVLELAERAYTELGQRYPYRPAEKIFLEAYNDPDDFAVRVAGVPHIGLLGVSFGDVLAINTPKGQPAGSYNWARTLWHEMVHTMSIGLANYRLPRWFAEGLAVYEEGLGRPEWGREMELELLLAFDQDKLLPLATIDRGFTRPSFEGQILLSYYHASEVIATIVDQHGFDAVVGILEGFARGESTAEAVQRTTGQTLEQVDAALRARLTQRRTELAGVLAGWPNPFVKEKPPSLIERMTGGTENALITTLREGFRLLEADDFAGAERSFREALTIYPSFIESGNAYTGLAAVYRETGDRARRIEILDAYLELSEHGAAEARELAELYREDGRTAEAVTLLARSLDVDPYDRDVLGRLAEGYLEVGQTAGAVRARRAILGLNPVDRSEAYYLFALSLLADGQQSQARRAVLQALELAPGYRDAQKLLLRLVDEPAGE